MKNTSLMNCAKCRKKKNWAREALDLVTRKDDGGKDYGKIQKT